MSTGASGAAPLSNLQRMREVLRSRQARLVYRPRYRHWPARHSCCGNGAADRFKLKPQRQISVRIHRGQSITTGLQWVSIVDEKPAP